MSIEGPDGAGAEPAGLDAEVSEDEPKRLVLFDIDGTLLKCGPQIRVIFEDALVEVFGTAGPIASYDFAGKTDHGIVWDLMAEGGLEASKIEELLPSFRKVYLERLDARLDGEKMRLMPGLPGVLERLRDRTEVVLGLLTGNFRRGAEIKLSRLGLDRFFAFGAFGDEVASRLDLPPVALAEGRATLGGWVTARRTVIVGDSLLDVECARAHGIGCVAVATGFASRDALASAGTARVVGDLLEAERLSFDATPSAEVGSGSRL